MPQPDHVSIFDVPDFDTLDEDMQAYIKVCQEKRGLVPNVLRMFSVNQEKLGYPTARSSIWLMRLDSSICPTGSQ